MHAAQKLMDSIRPNLISFNEYNSLFVKSIELQVDTQKKEELQDNHRDLVRNAFNAIQKARKRT